MNKHLQAGKQARKPRGSAEMKVAPSVDKTGSKPEVGVTYKHSSWPAAWTADAGADCLYAPGLRSRDEIAAVVAAVAPEPVNLLIGWTSDLTVADVAALGVRRISVAERSLVLHGGGFMRAARLIAEEGGSTVFQRRPRGRTSTHSSRRTWWHVVNDSSGARPLIAEWPIAPHRQADLAIGN